MGAGTLSQVIDGYVYDTRYSQCVTRCDRVAFVDKEDYEGLKELSCPFPGCEHTWCKNCQQTLTSGHGPKQSSCDGTDELVYLVRQMKWKYCPSKHGSVSTPTLDSCRSFFVTECRIPVQNIGGCNHVTVSR